MNHSEGKVSEGENNSYMLHQQKTKAILNSSTFVWLEKIRSMAKGNKKHKQSIDVFSWLMKQIV